MKLSLDPKTNKILALATKEDHEKIGKIIAELAGQNSDFEVIQLTKLDVQAAILTLEKFFGKQSKDVATAKGPIFYGDAASRRIMVKGTKEEVDQIRKLLSTVEESSPKAESSLLEGMLLLPQRGKSADRMLESIEMFMQAKKSKSRFRMILPEGDSKIKTSVPGNEKSVPAPKNVSDGRRASDTSPIIPFSKLVTFQENDGTNTPFGQYDDIVIRRGPNGLIVTSDNPQSLRDFNQAYELYVEQMKNAPGEPAVIVLKYIKAAAAEELIKSIIAGEVATGGGGGGLLGEVASSVLGGGGIFGGLFGGGGGSSSSASSGVTGAAATGTVVITSDPRFNALWVQANGADMQMVEDLVAMIDKADSGVENLTRGTPGTIFIRNVAVADVEALVKQVYADRIAQPAAAGGAQGQPNQAAFLALLAGGGGGGRRGGGGGGGAAQKELKEQTMTVSADKKNNALIVVAQPMLFEEVKKFVMELDEASADDESEFIVVPIPAEVNATTMQNALKSAFGASVKTSTASGTTTPGQTGTNTNNPADFFQQFRNRGGGTGGAGGGFPGAGGFGGGGFGGGGFGGQGGGGQRGAGGFGGGNQGGGGQRGGGGNQGGGGQRGGGGQGGGGNRGGR